MHTEVRVRRGPLFQFALKLPVGYTLTHLAATPEDAVASSEVAGGNVTVEFARPLGAGEAVELTLDFRGPTLLPIAQRVPVPAFTPLRPPKTSKAASPMGVFTGPG